MKKILLLGTGGTIACKRTPDGLKPVITSEEILTYVPDSRHYCEIDSIQILNIDSTNIQPSHWLAVSKAIEEHYEEYDGFVITHGTDTMAYTAAALSYPFSVVVLGNFRRFLLVIFLFLFLHLDFSFIYNKFSMPFWDFFY